MRILFINGQPYLPQEVGGVETSTLDMSLALRDLGHRVAVMAGLKSGDWVWLSNRIKGILTGSLFPAGSYRGLPVYRGWYPLKGFPEVIAKERPDALVIQSVRADAYDIALLSVQKKIKTFFYVHDVSTVERMCALPVIPEVKFIANSPFTADLMQRSLGLSCDVIPPLMRPGPAAVDTPGKMVTMINPRGVKGGAIAIEVAARCADIPFLFVEAWSGNDTEVQLLKQKATALKNVTWLSVQTDMRSIYAMTKLLLVPSQCRETWGRVVSEAHCFGIPAIASRIGALPDTVGPGGVLVEPEADAAVWTEAVRSLWDVPGVYAEYAAAARLFSQREEIDPAQLALKFIRLLQN
ncbi:MAG TPA: glycosyltransferase [Spongiibacteraceae bacterium]|nr:glycosyltransferase [Spongiibacteraceae bacterium]